MRILARRIEHPPDVPIKRSHHADARVHQEIANFGSTRLGHPIAVLTFLGPGAMVSESVTLLPGSMPFAISVILQIM